MTNEMNRTNRGIIHNAVTWRGETKRDDQSISSVVGAEVTPTPVRGGLEPGQILPSITHVTPSTDTGAEENDDNSNDSVST